MTAEELAADVGDGGNGASGCAQQAQRPGVAGSRIERRKAAKKEKRKQRRKELAAKEREAEEARLNDPEEQRRIQLEEERERERVERERREFEEHERAFLEALAAKRKAEEVEEEEERRRKSLEDESSQNQVGYKDENSDDDWEYIEEGPPEIIWQGNEIIVKKKKVRVKRKDTDQQIKEDPSRPTSNPLPPQSEAFADYKNGSVASAQQLLDNVAQQTPNFGTEQDKAHCPFHLKTGACRFGSRCSRVHFYPDKSCTLLIKNMYNGPGLAWEQDEGLEHTDEEVERSYEEFYEDVHTEFLKFGEIVNFKVCKNGSSHLRGNVYIHYKSLDSALLAYEAINGRYFAGKQVTCEFIGVTKWKVAICGEYMKSRLKTCSRGTACNFIHCFRNPGGDYEWADMDRPPPTYWVKKMVALFGYSEESGYDNHMEHEGRSSSRMMTADSRYNSRRSLSRERDYSRSRYEEYDARRSRHWDSSKITRKSKKWTHDSDSDEGRGGDRHQSSTRNGIRNQIEVLETQDFHEGNICGRDSDGRQLDVDIDRRERHHGSTRESSSRREKVYGVSDDYDSENRTHGANSGGHPSDNERDTDRDRDGDTFHRQMRKSSRHQNKVPAAPDTRREKKETIRDSDSREEDQDRRHRHTRKRSRHSNEALGSIDEHGNSAKILKDKYNCKESDLEKLEPQKEKKHRHSSRGDRSSTEPNVSNSSAGVLESDRYHETTGSSHGERIKSHDLENIDKVVHTKSRERISVKHKTSFRDSSSDESCDTESKQLYSRRSKSHDSGYYSDEDVDKRGRWESEKKGPEKHRGSGRKLNSDTFDQDGGNSNYHNQNRDDRSRGSGQSRSRKSSNGLEEVDSAEECEESEERRKKHQRKHRSHGQSQHHKEKSS